MPDPVGQPEPTTLAPELGPPFPTGGGETDWTLAALHTAAASLAGPGTSLLLGMVPAGTGGRAALLST
jgi:hypothetical protein